MRAKSSKNTKHRVIHEGRFLKFLKAGDWEYVRRHNCTGIVIIVPVTDDGCLLFVEQYRPPVRKNVIEFPAGLVNDRGDTKKESVLTAAKRELLEETGYKASQIKRILKGPVSGGSSADLVEMFVASGLKKVHDGGGDEFEHIQVHKVRIKFAQTWLLKMQNKGRLIEPKIYAGLYFVNSYNNKSSRT